MNSYPSFFHVTGKQVRKYILARKQEVMVDFALETYKETAPLGLLASPYGPIGKLKGILVVSIDNVKALHRVLTRDYGFSPPASSLTILGGSLVFFGAVVVIGGSLLLQYLEPISQKYERKARRLQARRTGGGGGQGQGQGQGEIERRNRENRRRIRNQYAGEDHPHQD